MKMVILGAGASFDSIYPTPKAPENKWRPPLGNDLFKISPEFNAILDKYPGAKSFRSEAIESNDIEQFFQVEYGISQRADGSNFKLRLLNMQFYLQELFFNISENYNFSNSNYDMLVSKANRHCTVNHEDVFFVSFNYDTLLEKSLTQLLNFKFQVIDDYIKCPMKVFKPHGSCNWFNIIGNDQNPILNRFSYHGWPEFLLDQENYIFIDGLLNQLGQNLEIFNTTSTFTKLKLTRPNKFVIPHLLIPLHAKDDFLMPQNHIDELITCLKKVDQVLIIGWKANERHFLDCLINNIGNRDIKITYVCLGDNIGNRLKGVGSASFTRFVYKPLTNDPRLNSFSNFLRSKEAEYQFFKNK